MLRRSEREAQRQTKTLISEESVTLESKILRKVEKEVSAYRETSLGLLKKLEEMRETFDKKLENVRATFSNLLEEKVKEIEERVKKYEKRISEIEKTMEGLPRLLEEVGE